MFHGRKDRRLPRREFRHHLVIHRFVRIEAVDGVQVPAEILRPVERGELVLQGQSLKVLFQLAYRRILALLPSVQGYGKIVQVHKVAGGQEDMFVPAVVPFRVGNDMQRNIRRVYDLLDIRREPLLLLRHVAEGFQPRRIALFSAFFPFSVVFAELIDLVLLRFVIIVNGVDGIPAEVHIHRHRVQLCP